MLAEEYEKLTKERSVREECETHALHTPYVCVHSGTHITPSLHPRGVWAGSGSIISSKATLPTFQNIDAEGISLLGGHRHCSRLHKDIWVHDVPMYDRGSRTFHCLVMPWHISVVFS